MDDREKMIEVIREWSYGAFSPIYAGTLADRLIAAGFGMAKKDGVMCEHCGSEIRNNHCPHGCDVQRSWP